MEYPLILGPQFVTIYHYPSLSQDFSHFFTGGESFGMKIQGSFVSFCFVKKLLKDLGWQQPQQLPSKTCQRTKRNAENIRHATGKLLLFVLLATLAA